MKTCLCEGEKYYAFPIAGDYSRDLSFKQLLDLSLPYAEVGYDGEVYVAKAEGSGGVINFSTCAEQLLYEIGDPSAYITPDVVIDFRDVSFCSVSNDKVLCIGAKPSEQRLPDKLLQLVPKDCGWKGWGEISYGGYECIQRAKAADFLVRSWMEELFPGVKDRIISYIIGFDSLKATSICDSRPSTRDHKDIRLHMDGLFDLREHALHFVNEFTALYTNGPAGGGGISTGHKKEIILQREMNERESVFWRAEAEKTDTMSSCSPRTVYLDVMKHHTRHELPVSSKGRKSDCDLTQLPVPQAAPSGEKITLHQVAHSRAGDKGNDLNFSIIPHFAPDIERLKVIITPTWVKTVVSTLLDVSSFPDPVATDKRNAWIDEHVRVEIYEVKGIQSLNVVVRNILDGGVNCSRRIDRHGKCVSDLILCQQVVLPP